jgi:response regulator NasT
MPFTTPLQGKRVAIVEDEGTTIMQLTKALKSAGSFVVGQATDAKSAIDLVSRERPDLVLMDINMPGSYNGLEAARRILAEFQTCVVILTAYADYGEEAYTIGASGYVIKPLNGQSLLPQLCDALKRFQRRRSQT